MLPRGYYPEDVEEDVGVPARPGHGRPLWRRALPIVVVVAALAGFSGLLLATYFSSSRGGDGPPPVIHAETKPIKVRPDIPGGLEVPNQDIKILEEVLPGPIRAARPGDAPSAPRIERLLPPPDAPLPRPAAAPPVLQPEIPVLPRLAPPPDAIEVQPQPPQRRLTLPQALLQGQGAPPPPPANSGPIVLRPPGRGQQQAAAVAPPGAAVGSEPAALPADLPGFRIQLGVMRSAAEAEREWQRLRDNNSDLIGRLMVAIVPSGRGASTTFRIQAGPLLTESGAAGLCRRLAARGAGCFVVKR